MSAVTTPSMSARAHLRLRSCLSVYAMRRAAVVRTAAPLAHHNVAPLLTCAFGVGSV